MTMKGRVRKEEREGKVESEGWEIAADCQTQGTTMVRASVAPKALPLASAMRQ